MSTVSKAEIMGAVNRQIASLDVSKLNEGYEIHIIIDNKGVSCEFSQIYTPSSSYTPLGNK